MASAIPATYLSVLRDGGRNFFQHAHSQVHKFKPTGNITPTAWKLVSRSVVEAFRVMPTCVDPTRDNLQKIKARTISLMQKQECLGTSQHFPSISDTVSQLLDSSFENALKINLYNRIINNQTNLHIKGSPKFQKAIHLYFFQFLESKTGRLLVERVIQTGVSLTIKESSGSWCSTQDSTISIYTNEKTVIASRNPQGELFWAEVPKYIVLVHELIHFLQETEEHRGFTDKATLKGFPNLSEQYVVTGNRGDGYVNPISESAIEKELGLPARATYDTSSFPLETASNSHDHYKRYTRLHEAARFGILVNIRNLVVRGVNLEARDKYGNTALHQAVRNGHYAVAHYLLEQDADIDAETHSGDTPVQLAVHQKNPSMLKLLLRYNPSLEVMNSNGYTPFPAAAVCRDCHTARILAANGADVLAVTKRTHKTALKLSSHPGIHAIVRERQLVPQKRQSLSEIFQRRGSQSSCAAEVQKAHNAEAEIEVTAV